MWVIIAIAIISSPMTSVVLYLLPDSVKQTQSDSLLSALGFQIGGPFMGVAVVVAASALLFMACNTAIWKPRADRRESDWVCLTESGSR